MSKQDKNEIDFRDYVQNSVSKTSSEKSLWVKFGKYGDKNVIKMTRLLNSTSPTEIGQILLGLMCDIYDGKLKIVRA